MVVHRNSLGQPIPVSPQTQRAIQGAQTFLNCVGGICQELGASVVGTLKSAAINVAKNSLNLLSLPPLPHGLPTPQPAPGPPVLNPTPYSGGGSGAGCPTTSVIQGSSSYVSGVVAQQTQNGYTCTPIVADPNPAYAYESTCTNPNGG